MALPIELDLVRWTRVSPEGKSQKVKALSFACYYYRGEQTPPELASEGTEIAANGEITMTRAQAPYWFRTKKAATTEEQKPSILELQPVSLENVAPSEILAGALNVRQAEQRSVSKKRSGHGQVAKDADTVAMEMRLSNALGLKVKVLDKGRRGGEVRILYKSLEQLDEVSRRLSNGR